MRMLAVLCLTLTQIGQVQQTAVSLAVPSESRVHTPSGPASSKLELVLEGGRVRAIFSDLSGTLLALEEIAISLTLNLTLTLTLTLWVLLCLFLILKPMPTLIGGHRERHKSRCQSQNPGSSAWSRHRPWDHRHTLRREERDSGVHLTQPQSSARPWV